MQNLKEQDELLKLGNSLMQYGPLNDRVYLMKLGKNDYPEVVQKAESLAKEHSLGKIFTKAPSLAVYEMEKHGYVKEAFIPNYYNGKENVFFMCKYVEGDRKKEPQIASIKEIVQLAQNKRNSEPSSVVLSDDYSWQIMGTRDVQEMAALYAKVFPSYPFPIMEPDYLLETMESHVIYFGVFYNNKLVGLSSSEMDKDSESVEMTDFAVLPEHRGAKLAVFLLEQMEAEMKQMGLKTAYTIARAVSPGMNLTFAKRAYTYTGTLIQNTNISGSFESMNVWYKSLMD